MEVIDMTLSSDGSVDLDDAFADTVSDASDAIEARALHLLLGHIELNEGWDPTQARVTLRRLHSEGMALIRHAHPDAVGALDFDRDAGRSLYLVVVVPAASAGGVCELWKESGLAWRLIEIGPPA